MATPASPSAPRRGPPRLGAAPGEAGKLLRRHRPIPLLARERAVSIAERSEVHRRANGGTPKVRDGEPLWGERPSSEIEEVDDVIGGRVGPGEQGLRRDEGGRDDERREDAGCRGDHEK